jgi:L,D-transpeptidase YcbB
LSGIRSRLLLFAVLSCLAWLPSGNSLAESVGHIEAALKQQPRDVPEAGGLRGRSGSKEAVSWFYAERGYAPAWNWGGRLEQLVAALPGLENDGLDPEDYGLSDLRRKMAEADIAPVGIACIDLLATEAYLTAMLDLALGRLDPSEVEPIWHAADAATLEAQRERVIILAATMMDDIEGAFSQVRPSTPQYLGLRNAYIDLLHREPGANRPMVPPGPLLREGDRDPRVVLLRERLWNGAAEGWSPNADPDGQIYDAELAAALVALQRAHGLAPDGIVGPETLAAMNRSVPSMLEQIRVNLERMRWLARAPLVTGVVVDIAGAEIRYLRDGETVWSARTQVGRPSRQTPRLRSEVTHLTFNPSWTVPPTILNHDMLPQVRGDIGYLTKHRMQVLDYRGNRLDPEEIDWNQPGAILLRQDPGPHNALGRVAFRFPNPFHVYLHDTPSQRIFERPHRQVSSGCVRVERPMELVDLLIEDGSNADPEDVAAIIAGGETMNFYLTRPVPILVGYWTADVTADGSVVFRPDIYAQDEKIARALEERPATDRLTRLCADSRDPS